MARRPQILVVEDDADYAASLRLVLESQSFRVLSATTLDEAFRAVEKAKPDLILLDIMLPSGTEGFHFVWGLRNHPQAELRNIPVVVVTSLHQTTELRLYPEQYDTEYQPREFLPVQAFLDKPLKPTELLEQVRRVLSGR